MPPVPNPEYIDEVIDGDKSMDEFLAANRDLKPDEIKRTSRRSKTPVPVK